MKKRCVPHKGRGQLFIAKAPEEIRMGKPEKKEAWDSRYDKRGNR
jgi:hypothetical protein